MMKRSLPLFVIGLTLLCSSSTTDAHTHAQKTVTAQTSTESTEIETAAQSIPVYTLDNMLTHFKASKTDTVELTLFTPIAFSANLVELPYGRKHGYLAREIQRYSPNSNIIATKGITVAGESKQALSVYIIDELAAGMTAELAIGDRINFQAYHVYNTINGPGLLVYQWVTPPQENFFQRNVSKLLHLIENGFGFGFGFGFDPDENDENDENDEKDEKNEQQAIEPQTNSQAVKVLKSTNLATNIENI